VLDWKEATDPPPRSSPFKGIRSELVDSAIAGHPVVRWTGEPVNTSVSLIVEETPAVRVKRPGYYYIPVAWRDIAERLSWQGIQVERLDRAQTVNVEMYRVRDAKPEVLPGMKPATHKLGAMLLSEPVVELRELVSSRGSFRVSTVPIGDLVCPARAAVRRTLLPAGGSAEVLNRTGVRRGARRGGPLRVDRRRPARSARHSEACSDDPTLVGSREQRLDWVLPARLPRQTITCRSGDP
jgi:hypothetical protein